MPNHCVVPWCKTNYQAKSDEKVTIFRVPYDGNVRQLWQKVIPRDMFVLKRSHYVCEKHFVEDDILTKNEHKDQFGNVIGIVNPRMLWWDNFYPQIHMTIIGTTQGNPYRHDNPWFVLGILWCVGLWPSATSGRMYRCWVAVCTGTMMTIWVFEIVKLKLAFGDVHAFTESLCLLMTQTNVLFKGLHLMWTWHQIRDLVVRAASEVSQDYRQHCNHILEGTHYRIRNLGITFYVSSSMTTLAWIFSPIVRGILEPNKPWSLPINSWYPFDFQSSSIIYWSTYAFETFYAFLINSWYSSLTLIYIFLLIGACSRFEMVSVLFEMSDERAEDLCKIEKAFNLSASLNRKKCYQITSKEFYGNVDWNIPSGKLITEGSIKSVTKNMFETNLKKIWIDYVHYHDMAFRYVKELRVVFSLIVLAQVLTCLGIICQAGFLILVKKGSITDVLKYSGYLVTVLFELLLYCWYGNEIIYQSSAVQAAVYDSPWLRGSPQLRAVARTVMARSQSKLALTAGGMHTLSLNTFTAILKNSYSLFALLREISEEK